MMKYFYLHTYGNSDAKKTFGFFHCPMDQQLLDLVWKNRNNLSTSAHKGLGRGADFKTCWGNEQFALNCGRLISCLDIRLSSGNLCLHRLISLMRFYLNLDIPFYFI